MTAGHVRADAAMRAVALAGLRSGQSMREIGVDLYGADWHGDSRTRAKVRWLADRARAAPDEGSDKPGPGT